MDTILVFRRLIDTHTTAAATPERIGICVGPWLGRCLGESGDDAFQR
jgi:hypothetical protein